MLVSELTSLYCEIHCKKGNIRGIKQPEMNQYFLILLHITWVLNWVLHNITQYYMDITILLNHDYSDLHFG